MAQKADVVFFPDSFKTQSTLYKIHCTLFEDNGKQGRQFRLRWEYSNVERIVLRTKATVFSNRPRGTERAKRINARHGINYLLVETMKQSSQRNLCQTCTMKVLESTTPYSWKDASEDNASEEKILKIHVWLRNVQLFSKKSESSKYR